MSAAPPRCAGRGRADRQADRARGPVLAARRRGAGSPPGGSRSTAWCWRRRRVRVRPGQRVTRRRQAAAGSRADPPVPLPQAQGRGDLGARPGGPRHDLRHAARGPAAADADRAPRHRLRGPAAADQRRRAQAPAGAARHRLAAALPRARASARSTDRQLQALAQGVTVDGIAYGPIEAQLDRTQGDNAWLTCRLREGKNREVRRVLRACRAAGEPADPHRLRAVPAGHSCAKRSVEEVPAKVLREQLGALVEPPARRAGGPRGRGRG